MTEDLSIKKYARSWKANRRRLDEAGYTPGPMIRIKLDDGRVAIIEGRTGITVGTLPPTLADPKTGKTYDLQDPMTLVDEGAMTHWLILAWYHLTGESPTTQ